MALFKSQVLTQASGSVGGLVYSHAKGGMYMRARAIPVNPQTARQNQIRDAMAMYSQMWLSSLDQLQRDTWDLYGANVAMTNRLGDTIFLSGQNHYIRANVVRQAANVQLSLAAPLSGIEFGAGVFDLPTLGAPSIVGLSSGTGDMAVEFDDSQPWVNDDQNAILVYLGRPRNITRRFFKGPYRLAGIIQGDAGTPPTSPAILPNMHDAFPLSVGQLVKTNFTLSVGNLADAPTGLSTKAYSEVNVGA